MASAPEPTTARARCSTSPAARAAQRSRRPDVLAVTIYDATASRARGPAAPSDLAARSAPTGPRVALRHAVAARPAARLPAADARRRRISARLGVGRRRARADAGAGGGRAADDQRIRDADQPRAGLAAAARRSRGATARRRRRVRHRRARRRAARSRRRSIPATLDGARRAWRRRAVGAIVARDRRADGAAARRPAARSRAARRARAAPRAAAHAADRSVDRRRHGAAVAGIRDRRRGRASHRRPHGVRAAARRRRQRPPSRRRSCRRRCACASRCGARRRVPERTPAVFAAIAAGLRRLARGRCSCCSSACSAAASIRRPSTCAISRCTRGRRRASRSLTGDPARPRRRAVGSARSPASIGARAVAPAARMLVAGTRVAAGAVARADLRWSSALAPAAAGPFRSSAVLLGRGDLRAPRRSSAPRLVSLVPPHDGRGADPRAVRGVSAAGAARLSVGALLRRALDAAARSRRATPSKRCSTRRRCRIGCRKRWREIDALPGLPDLVAGAAGAADGAAAHRHRVPAVEPDRAGARAADQRPSSSTTPAARCVSRFALNFPEYTRRRADARDAAQLPVGRVRRGAALRRARSATCCTRSAASASNGARDRGTIVVHVVFDYRTLPFITSQSAYFEVFRHAGDAQPARRHAGRRSRVRHLRLGSDGDLHLRPGGVADRRRHVRAHLHRRAQPFWTVLRKQRHRYNVYFSNDRLFIYAIGYPRPDRVRSPRAPRRADDARGGRSTSLVLLGNARVHAPRAGAAADRPRAAARDPRQLLPEAVPRVRARVDHPGADARAGDPRRTSPTCCSTDIAGRSGAHGRRRAARHRGIRTRCCSAAPKALDAVRRRRDGLDQPGDRSGRQHLRRRASSSRRASAICSRRACCRRARPTTSIAPSCCSGCRASSARIASATFRTRSRPRRCAPAGANAILTVPLALPAARHRARDRRSRSRRPPRGAVLHPARRRRSGCRWPSASPIRSAG